MCSRKCDDAVLVGRSRRARRRLTQMPSAALSRCGMSWVTTVMPIGERVTRTLMTQLLSAGAGMRRDEVLRPRAGRWQARSKRSSPVMRSAKPRRKRRFNARRRPRRRRGIWPDGRWRASTIGARLRSSRAGDRRRRRRCADRAGSRSSRRSSRMVAAVSGLVGAAGGEFVADRARAAGLRW